MSSKLFEDLQFFSLTILTNQPPDILNFKQFTFLSVSGLRVPFCITMLNFMTIGQTVAEILHFVDCCNTAAGAIMDFQKLQI